MPHSIGQAPSNSAQVCSSVLSGFDRFVARRGIDPVWLDQHFAVSAKTVLPGRRIPLANVCEALFQTSRLLNDGSIGLDYGLEFEPRSLGMFGYLALSSHTVSEALLNMQRFFGDHQQRSALRVIRGPKLTTVEYAIDDPGIRNRRQDAELSLVVIRNILAHAEGGALPLLGMEFVHEVSTSPRHYEDALGCRIRFGCRANRLLLDNADLDRRMTTRDPYLLSLTAASFNEAGSLPQQETIRQRVADSIVSLLPEGEPTLVKVAEMIDVAAWTLRRRLCQEGVNFTTLVDDIRRTAAECHLEEAKLSMLEIAQVLGYAESSGLSRAFTRWHGVSPRAWRNLRGQRPTKTH